MVDKREALGYNIGFENYWKSALCLRGSKLAEKQKKG